MLLTISTTHRPTSDLGYLLNKHPGRFQSFDLSFGRAHVFYPEVGDDRVTASLLLDVDPVGMVRGKNRDPSHELISLSWLVNHKLLYLLATADTRGRATDSMSRPEENLQFWKLTAEENDCFTKPYPFPNDHARFLFYRQPNSDRHYVPHEDYRCTVTVMSGLPGSGKDTWLAKNRPELPLVSLDDIRSELDIEATDDQGTVIQHAKERCRELLRSGISFAFSATNLLRQTRKRWIDLFSDYGARIEIVYVEPPLSMILDQNKRRHRSVPDKVIRGLADKCEPPTWAEAHSLITVGQ